MENQPWIKQRIFDILDESEKTRTSEKVYDVFSIILISLNVLAVIIEPSVQRPAEIRLLNIFETFSIIVFSAEYLLRLWVSDITFPAETRLRSAFRYLFSAMALIDLAAILPFYLPLLLPVDLRVLRVFRIFRMLRIFKANRYTDALGTVIRVIKLKSEQLISSLFVVVALMVVASTVMFNIENEAQPAAFASVLDALFWSTAMLTNIEYGEVFPVTLAGKALGGFIALLSVFVIAIPTGIVASGFTEMAQQDAAAADRQVRLDAPIEKTGRVVTACPHCGKSLALTVAGHIEGHVEDRGNSNDSGDRFPY